MITKDDVLAILLVGWIEGKHTDFDGETRKTSTWKRQNAMEL
jgi:hypothetical protein